MIIDKLENKNLYININSNFKKAFEFLSNNKLEQLTDGKYEIDSNNVYALVQSYTTKAEECNKWESHQKYIDIQYIVNGDETILWSPVELLAVQEEYSVERDVTFYEESNYSTRLNLKDTYFGIFFPGDGHKPGCIFNKQMKMKKVVVKIKL